MVATDEAGATVPTCKDENSNCILACDPDDGLPVQCVGIWAKDKHYYLERFINATRHVRAQFNPPRGPGGTAFIDLFAGPGRARVDKPVEFIDGSPLVALKTAQGPSAFSKVVLCDIKQENVDALRARTASFGSHVEVIRGDCNRDIDEIASHIPLHSYALALVDPFGPSALHFNTIRRLSKFAHLDFIIHWPVGSMKRLFREHEAFENVLGLPRDRWGVDIQFGRDVGKLLPVYRRQLAALGYLDRTVNAPAIVNTSNLVLYRLVFASKHPLGDDIWNSITNRPPNGQTSLLLR